MYTFPAASATAPRGKPNAAAVPGPPSPRSVLREAPTIVIMTPLLAFHRRTHKLPVSAMATLPAASTATPPGSDSAAVVPVPPSPLYALRPLPMIVEMTPVLAFHRRTRLLSVSAITTLPTVSTATDWGPLNNALTPAVPSPM